MVVKTSLSHLDEEQDKPRKWYVSKIFCRFETFLQSYSVATSKLLNLIYLLFSTVRLIFTLFIFYS